jgi:uncharacterized membrane protein
MELLGDVGHVEAHFGLFGDGANLDARWVHKFAPNVLEAWKSFWMHRIELLGDAGHVEPRFGPFGDTVSVSARLVHGLRRMYHSLRNHFGCTQWNSYVTWVMWNLVLVYLETVLVLVQDRSTVCGECTVGIEIILDGPDGTPR